MDKEDGGDMGLIELSLWDKLKRIKADKVVGAVEGNFAKLDANGNLVDSGHKDSDYEDADATILKEADVVDSLDSTSTTAPLSANQGKVLDGKVNEVKSSLLTTKLAVNELERQAQIGNGATLDFSDIGIVPLDARATGRVNPTVKGLTATNLLGTHDVESTLVARNGGTDKANIGANNGFVRNTESTLKTVPFVAGQKYFAVIITDRVDAWWSQAGNLSIRQGNNFVQGFDSTSGTLIVVGIITPTTSGSYTIGLTLNNITGADISVTFYSAQLYNLTSIYGAGNEPDLETCKKLFSNYFDGTKSIQLPARVRSVSEDESETSTLYIADNEEVRSVPAIADEVKVVNGEVVKVQNVQKIPLNSSSQVWQFDAIRDSDAVAIFYFSNNNVHDWVIQERLAIAINRIFSSAGSSVIPAGLEGKDRVFVSQYGNFNILVTFTTLGTTYEIFKALSKEAKVALFIAWLDTQGLEMFFQVNNPITTPLTTSGTLKAFQNGTVYYEPYYEGSHQTNASSKITLPYEGTIEAVYGYDENLTEYLLDSSEYSLTGATLTITDALENEVWFVQMSRSEPLAPEMSVNTLNNEQVIADTENGKFYKLVPTITHGELVSQTPVEVV